MCHTVPMATASAPAELSTEMDPTGWGDPARRTGLPAHAGAFLREHVGAASPTPAPGRPVLRPSSLSD